MHPPAPLASAPMLPEHEDAETAIRGDRLTPGFNPRCRATVRCRDGLRRVTAGGERFFGTRVLGYLRPGVDRSDRSAERGHRV